MKPWYIRWERRWRAWLNITAYSKHISTLWMRIRIGVLGLIDTAKAPHHQNQNQTTTACQCHSTTLTLWSQRWLKLTTDYEPTSSHSKKPCERKTAKYILSNIVSKIRKHRLRCRNSCCLWYKQKTQLWRNNALSPTMNSYPPRANSPNVKSRSDKWTRT